MITPTVPTNVPQHLSTYRDDWTHLVDAQSDDGLVGSYVDQLRRNAWQEFERIGFPVHRRGNEEWKYTDLREIDRIGFRFGGKSAPPNRNEVEALVPLPDSWMNVVFVDGKHAPELSDSYNLLIGSKVSGIIDGPILGRLAPFANDGFVALNTAFLADGICVEIDDATTVNRPLHFVFVTTQSDGASRAVFPRFAIDVGAGSSATLIETHVAASEGPHLSVPVGEITLKQNAELNHFRLQMDGDNSYHFATTRVVQSEGSAYASTSFALGSSIGRNDVHTQLDGEHAECTLHGVYITTASQHQDNEISTTHAKPHCKTDQYFKGILSGRSRAVFSGKITVERGAQKTDANQKDLNLLLSHGAEVDTKPSLEIYADDVKCAHGATAGHVDENTLFYLQSRGVDYATAQAMLIRGFATEILDEFEDEVLGEFLSAKLDEVMPSLQAASDTVGTA